MAIMTKRSIHVLTLLAAVLLTGLLISGCGKDKDEVKFHTREGRVAAINKETGAFEGWFYSKKHKKELKMPGRLDPNVEIVINGATASVDDVRIDDKVTVTVKEIKRRGERELIATKVEVTRIDEEAVPAASEPTPKSAELAK